MRRWLLETERAMRTSSYSPREVRWRSGYSACSDAGGIICFFFFQAEDGIRDVAVTGVQTCALPIYPARRTVFWFLKGLHTMPARGWKFLLFVWNGWLIPFVPTCTRETVAGSKTVKRLAASVGGEYQL